MAQYEEKNLWQDTCQNRATYPELLEDKSVDCAIIGGGYTGLSAALHLSEQGQSVAVLEANQIGSGGSGLNVGLVNAGLWLKPDEVTDRLGEAHGKKLIAFLGDAPSQVFSLIEKHQIACEAKHNGTLHCADTSAGRKALEQRQEQWARYGADLSLLDKAETASLTGTNAFCASLHDPRAGSVQPLGYAHGLAKAAAHAGAAIYCNSPVLSVTRNRGAWLLKTAKASIRAEKIISATGAYNRTQADHECPKTTALYYFQFATEPLSDTLQSEILPEKHGTWDTHQILTSYRMNDEGRMIIGSVGRLDGPSLAIHKAWAMRKLAKVYPKLSGMPFTHQWHGRIGLTLNHIPRIAMPHPDWLSLWAYNGRGIAPGTAFGKLLAEMHLTGDNDQAPLPVSDMRSEAFTQVQSFAIEFGASAYHIVTTRV